MARKKSKKKAKKKAISKHKPPKPVRVHFDLRTKTEPEKPEPAPAKPKITPYPTADAKVQEFEDLLDSHLAGYSEPAKPKRGPGRPPKEKPQEPEQPEQPELTIDVVAGVIKIPFELWAISQSVKSLALTDVEAKKIAEPAKQLLEYYLPRIPVIAYAWISMSVSTFWVMQTRLRTIKEIKLHRERLKYPKSVSPEQPAEPAQPGVKTKFPSVVKTKKM